MKFFCSLFIVSILVLFAFSSCEKDAVATPVEKSASFKENFDTVANLYNKGWVVTNNSRPLGVLSWFQGNGTVFPAYVHNYTAADYIAANFNGTATTGGATGNISNWLISPITLMKNGDKIVFYTRTATNNTRAERLQVRINSTNNSANVEYDWHTVGNFTTLLLDINPSYGASTFPQVWTRQEVTISGLPAPINRRFAIRYFVENGGLAGTRSNFIGVDELEFISAQ